MNHLLKKFLYFVPCKKFINYNLNKCYGDIMDYEFYKDYEEFKQEVYERLEALEILNNTAPIDDEPEDELVKEESGLEL